jgi:hypothetical protein
MQSERKTRKNWKFIVFLLIIVVVLAGATIYLLGVKHQWQDEIRRTMDANVESGGKMSLVEETRKKRIEFFLRRSIRKLPHKTAYSAGSFLQSLSAMTPVEVEYRDLSFKPRLHSLLFTLEGHYRSDTIESFKSRWKQFINRMQYELPLIEVSVSLADNEAAEGDFVIQGELELQ